MSEVKDPWVVQAPGQAAQVPVGFYNALFKGVEEFKMESGEIKWRFSWEVKSGVEAGKLATALTDRNIKPTTLPGQLISGLLGRAITTGENVQAAVEECIGKAYMIGVQPGPKGGKPGVRTCGKPPTM